jgi:hypothetical protein
MKTLRLLGRYAACAILTVFMMLVLIMSAALVAVFVKNHGGDEVLQTTVFCLVCGFLCPVLLGLIYKADL